MGKHLIDAIEDFVESPEKSESVKNVAKQIFTCACKRAGKTFRAARTISKQSTGACMERMIKKKKNLEGAKARYVYLTRTWQTFWANCVVAVACGLFELAV